MIHSKDYGSGEPVSRRRFLGGCCLGSIVGALGSPGVVLGSEGIVQPGAVDDQAFIARAFELRRLAVEKGDQPYGAVVVLAGRIVGQSWSRVVLDSDPTGHAEMSAIRDAGRRLGRRQLSGAILYSSSLPCPMCEAAAAWVGIGEMIYGKEALRAGRPERCG